MSSCFTASGNYKCIHGFLPAQSSIQYLTASQPSLANDDELRMVMRASWSSAYHRGTEIQLHTTSTGRCTYLQACTSVILNGHLRYPELIQQSRTSETSPPSPLTSHQPTCTAVIINPRPLLARQPWPKGGTCHSVAGRAELHHTTRTPQPSSRPAYSFHRYPTRCPRRTKKLNLHPLRNKLANRN